MNNYYFNFYFHNPEEFSRMTSRFAEQVPISNQTVELLPIYHTCDSWEARSHVERGKIETSDTCEVFNEKITYFFYGRPAFKYATDGASTTDLAMYPICFVMNVEKISPLKRIFPFDTGAMFHERLKAYFHPKMTHLDFELEPKTARINDVVLHFFGGSQNYSNSTISKRNHAAEDFESVSYSKMIESHTRSAADERRVTIELHGDQTIKLTKSSLQAIILPTPLRDSKLFKKFIKANAIKAVSYDITVWNPALAFSLVSDAAMRYSRSMGHLK